MIDVLYQGSTLDAPGSLDKVWSAIYRGRLYAYIGVPADDVLPIDHGWRIRLLYSAPATSTEDLFIYTGDDASICRDADEAYLPMPSFALPLPCSYLIPPITPTAALPVAINVSYNEDPGASLLSTTIDFDNPLDTSVLTLGNWTVRWQNMTIPLAIATVNDRYQVLLVGPNSGPPDVGPDQTAYMATPPDLIGLFGHVVPAFTL